MPCPSRFLDLEECSLDIKSGLKSVYQTKTYLSIQFMKNSGMKMTRVFFWSTKIFNCSVDNSLRNKKLDQLFDT